MTCADAKRWMDEGMPAHEAPASRAHAASCAECAAALESALALEALLREAVLDAPPGFTNRVMRRVSALESSAAAAAISTDLAWWVRAAADPAVVLAAALAGVVVWQWSLLQSLARQAMVLGSGLTFGTLMPPPPESWLSESAAQLGLVLAAVPVAVLASIVLYHWTKRLVAGASGQAPQWAGR